MRLFTILYSSGGNDFIAFTFQAVSSVSFIDLLFIIHQRTIQYFDEFAGIYYAKSFLAISNFNQTDRIF